VTHDVRAESLLGSASARLDTIHRRQVHRDGWPEFDAFDRSAYPEALRRASAAQWMRRARLELGSVHEFSALTHALARARAPVDVLGSLSRLVTDEVRHVELCARMAETVWPEGRGDATFEWPPPRFPYSETPAIGATDAEIFRWSAELILSACCIGETLSRPLFESVATVCTDPVCEAAIRQILRDEHLHATFGWETLAHLLERLSPADREWLETRLSSRLAGFERTSSAGLSIEEIAGTEVEVERDPSKPNLGTISPRQYATIFYATLEAEILPRFAELGFDAIGAWARRPRAPTSAR
jgi:hypothetical protein